MSFIICEQKNSLNSHGVKTNGNPIAILKGIPRAEKARFVYYKEYLPNLDDLKDKSLVSHLEPIQLDELKKSLENITEPETDSLVNIYYKVLNILRDTNKRLVLRGKASLFPLPEEGKSERVYICGISGSGKSYFAGEYIKQYLRIHKKNNFLLTSQIEEDAVLDKLEPDRISPDELLEDGVKLEEVKDSIWLFDDIFSLENKKDRLDMISIVDNLAETSRHDNISLVITSHLISTGQTSRRVLNEATKIVLFPRNNKKQIKYFLDKYEFFKKDDIDRILNLNSRWVMINKQSTVHIVLYEKGCYVI